MGWLESRIPADPDQASLIHNDFRLDNLVLDPGDVERDLRMIRKVGAHEDQSREPAGSGEQNAFEEKPSRHAQATGAESSASTSSRLS